MGITQIDIKINQTKLLSGGKPNSASLSDAPINSFEQVLSMFNFLGQTPKKDGQTVSTPMETVSHQLSDDHDEIMKDIHSDGQFNSRISIDLFKPSTLIKSSDSLVKLIPEENDLINQLKSLIGVTKDVSTSLENSQTSLINQSETVAQSEHLKLNEEDWEKIDNILTSLVTSIQQAPQSNVLQKNITNSESVSNLQTTANSISVSSLRNANLEFSKVLAPQGEGLVGEIDQQHSLKSSKVMQGLSDFISELNANKDQKALVIPVNIKEKIQIIMNELKSIEESSGIELSTSQPNNDTLRLKGLKGELSNNSKPVLSLDKNHVIFPSKASLDSIVPDENKLATQGKVPEENKVVLPVSIVPEENKLATPVSKVPEENKLATPVSRVPEGYKLATPVSKVPEENKLATPVSKISEENKLAIPVSKVPEENKLATPVNKVPEENKLATPVSKVPVENKLATPVSEVPDENKLAIPVNIVPEENRAAKQVSRVSIENRVVRSPIVSQIDDLIKGSGQPVIALHQQRIDGKELKPETMPTKLSVSEFAPEVSEWINRFAKITSGKSGSTEAKFSLYPEHLGHIEIKINSQQGQISAEILTDTPLAKEVLEGQVQHLRAALQQSGLQVQKIDIVQQSPVSTDPYQSGLSFSQGGSSSSSDQRAFTPSRDGTKDQKESTEQIERDLESVSITYGGSPKKTSSRIDFNA